MAAAGPEAAARLIVGAYGPKWRHVWRGLWARPQQLSPEGAWFIWLFLAGRGSGKTRSGAEWVRECVDAGAARRVALVARTAADARDVLVEGDSGLLGCYPSGERPLYEPSKRRLTWRNGAIATTYSADEPDALRGPQHDLAWADELAAWERAGSGGTDDPWNNLLMGLRLGKDPRCIVTTTPRPTPLIRSLLDDPTCVVRRASTYDNRQNLAPSFFAKVIKRFEGTRLGLQELYAEVLAEGTALWTKALLDATRVPSLPPCILHAVGVDPSAGSGAGNDEQGIAAASLDASGHLYVREDATVKLSPAGWGHAAVMAAVRTTPWAPVDVEPTCGGAMAKHPIETAAAAAGIHGLRVEEVTAKRGKHVRAEPISAIWEQGRAHIVGTLEHLEAELCGFMADGYSGSRSPNRADAAIWAATGLLLAKRGAIVTGRAVGVRPIMLPRQPDAAAV